MASASSSSCLHERKYDVFLSFRGEDTRSNFVDHLYSALDKYKIYTFKDDQLERGKSISAALTEAIEESRFAIIVFSKNYASSSWCLDELVKILHCKEKKGQTIFPIFYNVDPSEVRKQSGSFAEAFAEHENLLGKNTEKVKQWRRALEEAANLSGWVLRKVENGYEMTCIKEIIQEVLKELRRAPRKVADAESWKYSLLSELMTLLDDERSMNVQNEESCGIGKTNFAEAIFKLSIENCFTEKAEMITLRSQLIIEKSKDKEKEAKKKNMKLIKVLHINTWLSKKIERKRLKKHPIENVRILGKWLRIDYSVAIDFERLNLCIGQLKKAIKFVEKSTEKEFEFMGFVEKERL